MSTDRVGIIGIGQSEFRSRRDDASYPELVREGVARAMQDAGLDFDAIQAVVYSLSPDAMVGIGNAERLGVDAVGGRNKPFLRINNGGATGISAVTAAYYHVASGMFDVVLTAGADKIGECGDSQTVLNKIWDPSYERPLPLGHDQHAGDVGGALHAALRHDRGGHGPRHGQEPPARGAEPQGASAPDRVDR